MSGELDELAATTADVLVSALGGDSWRDAKQWFTEVVGHEGRLAATRTELAGANGGPARDVVVQAQVRAWTVRLRDVFEDNPAAVRTLQDLIIGMRAQGLLPSASLRPAGPTTAPQPAAAPQSAASALSAPTLVSQPTLMSQPTLVSQAALVSQEAVSQETRPDPAPASELAVVYAQSQQEPPAAAPPTPIPFTAPDPGPKRRRLSRGKLRGFIAAGIAVVVAAAVVVSWQEGLFGSASPQFRPLAWTGTQAPLPGNAAALTSNSSYNALYGISCPATGTCLAVGELTPQAGSGWRLLVERFSNGMWTPEQTQPPLPADADPTGTSWLNYIVCSSPSACTAVGAYSTSAASTGNVGLVETLSGTTWTPAAVPLPAAANQDKQVNLTGVACPAAGDCIAAATNRDLGSEGNVVSGQALIATQDGGTWTSAEAPVPPDAATTAQDSELDFITCPGLGACTAVGQYKDKNGNQQGLIDTLADGTWTAAKAPLPKNAAAKPAVELWGISCASGACTAVGNYQAGSNSGGTKEKALIETLPSETASTAKAQSLLPEDESSLEAVYCVSAGSCLALGEDSGSDGLQSGLAATLTDGTWSTASMHLPANASTSAQSQGVGLWGVACPTIASCEVVGNYTTDTGATAPIVAAGTAAAATTGTAAVSSAGSAGAQPGAAGLPLGQGTFQIHGAVTEFDSSRQAIALQGTVDGLALTATGTGNGLAAGGFAGQGGYCGLLGLVGSSVTGSLGGVPFNVTLTDCSADNNILTATYTGTWGSRPVNLTLTTDETSDSPPTIGGTIGTQQVSGSVPNLVTASGAPGQTSQVSGTITVS